MGLRPGGISSITETSKSPYTVIASVRGIGVAVMTRMWGARVLPSSRFGASPLIPPKLVLGSPPLTLPRVARLVRAAPWPPTSW